MLSRFTHNNLVWIDLESPTREEVQNVMHEFGLDSSVAQELLYPTMRPRAEVYEHYMYLILHFPALHKKMVSREQEIDFIVGRNFVITTRFESIDPLHSFSKVFETDSLADKFPPDAHGGHMLFYMVKELYAFVEKSIEEVSNRLTKAEHETFRGHEQEMVATLSHAGRDLLTLRRSIEPHRDILNALSQSGPDFFGTDFKPFLVDLTHHYFRVHNHVMRNIESLHELRETNSALLSTKQNEITKLFTVLAFVTLPVTLLVKVLAIESPYNPILGRPNDFWIIVSIVLIVSAAMLWVFDRRGWL